MPVLVLGMHRSGTSVLARCTSLLGLSFGTGPLMEPQPDNPEGFWENERLTEFNDALLETMGGDWRKPPVCLRRNWWTDSEIRALNKSARVLLARTFGPAAQRWIWKDPRNCLTLPFWLQLMPARPVVLLAIRNPLEIYRSLHRRNGIPKREALALWEIYMRSALPHLHGLPILVVRYEKLVADPHRNFFKYATAFLDSHIGQIDEPDTERISSIVCQRYRHWRSSDDEFFSDPEVTDAQKQLFDTLLELPCTIPEFPDMHLNPDRWLDAFEVLEKADQSRKFDTLRKFRELKQREQRTWPLLLGYLEQIQRLQSQLAFSDNVANTVRPQDGFRLETEHVLNNSHKSLTDQIQQLHQAVLACRHGIRMRDELIKDLTRTITKCKRDHARSQQQLKKMDAKFTRTLAAVKGENKTLKARIILSRETWTWRCGRACTEPLKLTIKAASRLRSLLALSR